MKRTKYGRTLQKIAEAGADEFYSGKMAKQVQLLLILCIDYKPRYNWLKCLNVQFAAPWNTVSMTKPSLDQSDIRTILSLIMS